MAPGIRHAFKGFLNTLGAIEEIKAPVAAGAMWGKMAFLKMSFPPSLMHYC